MNLTQMALAITGFGFGTKIYARESYPDQSFFNILSCYIESGIPVEIPTRVISINLQLPG